nr:unnamed protein product [Digitaria exilis]
MRTTLQLSCRQRSPQRCQQSQSQGLVASQPGRANAKHLRVGGSKGTDGGLPGICAPGTPGAIARLAVQGGYTHDDTGSSDPGNHIAQSLKSTVRASKKGELLLMCKLGLPPPERAAAIDEQQPDLAAVFMGPMDDHYFAAMRDLFPAA